MTSLLPRVQHGDNNKNESLEDLGRGPPPAADAEKVQQGGQQQQQDNFMPRNMSPAGIQQQQNQGRQPGLVAEPQSGRE